MSKESKTPVMDRRAMFKTLVGRAPKVPEPVIPDEPAEPDPLFVSGSQALREGDAEKAVADLRPYVRAHQRHLEARRRLGLALYQLGRYVQARVEFETVLKRDKSDPLCRASLGLVFFRMGKAEKAAVAWEGLEFPGQPEMTGAALAGTSESAGPDETASLENLSQLAEAMEQVVSEAFTPSA